jgi:hypothetical protein
MTYSLPLIDKDDSFEIIRDKIAEILATETAAQQALATAGGKDPALWAFDVYKERSNPIDKFVQTNPVNTYPIVNVWYSTGNSDKASSNVSTRQKFESSYNIDCIGYGKSESDGGDGYIPGDMTAAEEAHRAAKLVRNILMADKYKGLELSDPKVWQRWISQIQSFQPQQQQNNVQHLVGVRITLNVEHNETTQQPDGETIELIDVDIQNDVGGSVVAELNIQ